jgi:hypothetical protein
MLTRILLIFTVALTLWNYQAIDKLENRTEQLNNAVRLLATGLIEVNSR